MISSIVPFLAMTFVVVVSLLTFSAAVVAIFISLTIVKAIIKNEERLVLRRKWFSLVAVFLFAGALLTVMSIPETYFKIRTYFIEHSE